MALSIRRLADSHLRSALIGSAISLATKLAGSIAGIVLTIVIARRFGAAGSGSWVLATTLLMIAGYISLCGLDYSTTRAVAIFRAEDRWSAIRGWMWTGALIITPVGLTMGLLAWLALDPIAVALSEGPTFTRIAAPLCVAILPYALLRFIAGLLRGVQRFATAELLESGFIPTGLVVAIIALGVDDLRKAAALYALFAILGATLGLILWLQRIAGKGRPADPLNVADALRRSLPLAGAVLATLASPWIMTLFLAKYATAADVGIFRVALQFALLLGFLLNAVETGLSPQIAALHNQNRVKELLSSTKNMTLLLVVIGGIPAVILLIFTAPFLSIMGPEFARGVPAMRILLLAQVFNLATGPVGSFMVMTGLGRLSFWNATAGAILVLLVSLFAIPRYGVEGAAAAGAAATIFRNFVATVIVWRVHGVFLPLGLQAGRGPPH